MNNVKVYIIDDHKLFIEGLYSLLADKEGLRVIGHRLSPLEALQSIHQINADVFLIDINMPEMSGFELAQKILEKKPGARMLALTMYDDYQYIEKMIKSGVMGYSLKSDTIKELVKAIKTVAAGKRYMSERLKEDVIDKIGSINTLDETEDIKKSKLTNREKEILLLITKEYSNKAIAEKLFISERTVETHRKNICSKTNANTSLGFLKYGIVEGIIKM